MEANAGAAPAPAAGQPMATVAETIDLEIELDQAWEAVSNFERFNEWLVLHSGFPDGAPKMEDVKVGTKVKHRIQFMGMPADVEWTITEWEPPNVVAMEGTGPMGTTMRIAARTESIGDMTRVTHESQFGGAALTPMLAVIEKEAQKASAASLARLRGVLGLAPQAAEPAAEEKAEG